MGLVAHIAKVMWLFFEGVDTSCGAFEGLVSLWCWWCFPIALCQSVPLFFLGLMTKIQVVPLLVLLACLLVLQVASHFYCNGFHLLLWICFCITWQ